MKCFNKPVRQSRQQVVVEYPKLWRAMAGHFFFFLPRLTRKFAVNPDCELVCCRTLVKTPGEPRLFWRNTANGHSGALLLFLEMIDFAGRRGKGRRGQLARAAAKRIPKAKLFDEGLVNMRFGY